MCFGGSSLYFPLNICVPLELSPETNIVVLRNAKLYRNFSDFLFSSVLQTVYSTSFLPALGHAVSALLHLVEKERLRELRIESMHCLCNLAQSHDPKGELLTKLKYSDYFAITYLNMCNILHCFTL